MIETWLLNPEAIYGTAVPWWIVTSLRNRFYPKYFIETGTGYGLTTIGAAMLFQHVHTIEIDPGIYAAQRKELTEKTNVIRHLGNSADVLPRLCQEISIDEPIFFYLDGHWAGAGDRHANECPLLLELAAIRQRYINGSRDVVMIDNWGMFACPPRPPHRAEEWPSGQDVLNAIIIPEVSCLELFDVLIVTHEPVLLRWPKE